MKDYTCYYDCKLCITITFLGDDTFALNPCSIPNTLFKYSVPEGQDRHFLLNYLFSRFDVDLALKILHSRISAKA